MKILKNDLKKRWSDAYEGGYSAMSLVEMLITIVILGIVLIVVAMTLTALIKASAISSARTLSRNESEFIFEILRRNIKNSKADDINVYRIEGRVIGDGGQIIDEDPAAVAEGFSDPIPAGSAGDGNEIQMRPTGSDRWVCIAWYPSSDQESSYIVRGTSPFSGEQCLANSTPVPLNEEEIIISDFVVRHYSTSAGNVSFVIDLEVTPLHWIPGPRSEFKPEYRRQLVVTTEKLTF